MDSKQCVECIRAIPREIYTWNLDSVKNIFILFSIEKEQNLTLLQNFIDELPELEKALMLLYLDEKPQKEIAEILGLSETNISTKITRIKNKLKQKFSTIQSL